MFNSSDHCVVARFRVVMFRVCTSLSALIIWVAATIAPITAEDNHGDLKPKKFRAGAYAQNISPTNWPVWVDGGITANRAERLQDPMHARCLVLDNGETSLAIVVVDSCSLPVPYVTEIRKLVEDATKIPASNVLISATHAHSAPSISGLHSTPVQEDYKEQLRGWIVEGVKKAQERLQPARVGSTSAVADQFIYCRDWLMKPSTAQTVAFTGVEENQVQMNPGYDNPNKIRNFGPVDYQIPILSVQTESGEPLAVLASFCTHYAGAPAVSADYFGVVCRILAEKWGKNSDQFVGLMANATSGDANCIDFSKPPKPFNHLEVGQYVAGLILDSLPKVEYRTEVPIAVHAETVTVNARKPTAEEAAAAIAYRDQRFPDRLPQTIEENYVRETILLSDMPATRDLPLIAMRIGDLAIAANPCETYNVSGLAIKKSSPLPLTMNIGLANGYGGYIPPPDRMKLGGYTTWRARSSCLELEAEPKMVAGLAKLLGMLKPSENADDSSKPSKDSQSGVSLRHEPLAIDESLKSFQLDSRFRLWAAAAEPLVVDPVDIDFDDAGRMWVVEMRDYPTGLPTPSSRIVVLEDTDGNGSYDRSQIFADGLLFATGLQLYKDGAIVTAAGTVSFLADRDGDGRAEVNERWLSGFAAENPQLRANHPTIAYDQTLYIANGLRGGQVRSEREGWPSESTPLELGSLDLRVEIDCGCLELVTGPAQFGLTFDDFGTRFFCSNRNPATQAVLEQLQLDSHPLAGIVPASFDVLPVGEQSRVHPITEAWTTSNLHAGQFTAACGVLFTNSSQFPTASHGHLLVCEPTGSLVHRRSVKRNGAVIATEDPSPEAEFLASRDSWFRPVNLTIGPDDCLYVADMHRAVIEHPDWVPDELKNRPDARWGDAAGRIYGIAATKLTEPQRIAVFNDLRKRPLRSRSTSELIDLLDHSSSWFRQTVARILAERPEEERKEGLLTFVRSKARPEGRFLALHLLDRSLVADESLLLEMLDDSSSEIRAAAASISASFADSKKNLVKELIDRLSDPDAYVRFRAATGLRTAPWNDELSAALVDYVVREREDPYAWMVASAVARKKSGEWLRLLIDRTRGEELPKEAWFLKSVQQLARRSVESKDENWLRVYNWLVESLDGSSGEADAIRLAVIEGWVQAASGAPAGEAAWQPNSLQNEPTWKWVAGIATDREKPTTARLSAIRILSVLGSSEVVAKAVLQEIEDLVHKEQGAVRSAAIRAWAKIDTNGFEPWSFEQFLQAGPELRSAIFDSWLQSERLASVLLDKLETDQISVRMLDASQLQTLQRVGFTSLVKRFQKIAAKAVDSDRVQLIAKYEPALTGDADPKRGKPIFVQHCASCHQMEGVGNRVGPDISDSRIYQPSQLLISILDPNRAVDNNFFRYRVMTDDGQVFEGIVVEESSGSVVLKLQNGERVTLDRENIEQMRSTGLSMMPNGFENQISPAQMADLISYIKNWRYLQGEVPLSQQ